MRIGDQEIIGNGDNGGITLHFLHLFISFPQRSLRLCGEKLIMLAEKRRAADMRAMWFLLLSSALVLFVFGCGEEAERENPVDPQNKRTGGTPPGVTARAGHSQVILSWPNLGLDGIKEYRIYRAYLTPTPDQFQHIATVQVEPIEELHEYEYTDTGLQNDDNNIYFYRLSYVDKDGQEIPDPKNPQNLSEDWFLVDVIPSEAPPVPDVQVMEDSDLQVRLIWEGYVNNAPDDLAGFKVYSAPKPEEGQKQSPFTLVAQIDDPNVEFYIDGNDYPNNIINFWGDGTTKLYKVIAFDKVGVESDSPILEGASPNLPPGPPPQVKGRFSLGINSYEVRIEWRESLEPDVIGYVVYAQWPDGKREFKKRIDDRNETVAIVSDRYVVTEGITVPKQYYVTAFDNTPKPDGKRDESEPSVLLSAD